MSKMAGNPNRHVATEGMAVWLLVISFIHSKPKRARTDEKALKTSYPSNLQCVGFQRWVINTVENESRFSR